MTQLKTNQGHAPVPSCGIIYIHIWRSRTGLRTYEDRNGCPETSYHICILHSDIILPCRISRYDYFLLTRNPDTGPPKLTAPVAALLIYRASNYSGSSWDFSHHTMSSRATVQAITDEELERWSRSGSLVAMCARIWTTSMVNTHRPVDKTIWCRFVLHSGRLRLL